MAEAPAWFIDPSAQNGFGNDGSIVWPADRKRVLLGTIRLTKVEANQEELQRSLTFNPTFLTKGIELSDDPLVQLRSAVYALSVAHRH